MCQTQTASSEASATLILLFDLPSSSRALRLLMSLALAFAASALVPGTGSCPSLVLLMADLRLGNELRPSTRHFRRQLGPLLVIEPREPFSPLECSLGVSPIQLRTRRPERKRLKSPSSAAASSAVSGPTLVSWEIESTYGFHLGFPSLYYANPIGWAFGFIVVWLRFRTGIWKTKAVVKRGKPA